LWHISLHPSIIDLPAYALALSLPWHWANDYPAADTLTDLLLQGRFEAEKLLSSNFGTQARYHLLCSESGISVCVHNPKEWIGFNHLHVSIYTRYTCGWRLGALAPHPSRPTPIRMAIRIGVGLLGWGASAPRLEMLYAPPGLFRERLTVRIGVGLLGWGASAPIVLKTRKNERRRN